MEVGLSRCPKCGKDHLNKCTDDVYDIEYYKCLCGYVIFIEDGFGKVEYKEIVKGYNLICRFCKERFTGKSPNRKVCYKEDCMKQRKRRRNV